MLVVAKDPFQPIKPLKYSVSITISSKMLLCKLYSSQIALKGGIQIDKCCHLQFQCQMASSFRLKEILKSLNSFCLNVFSNYCSFSLRCINIRNCFCCQLPDVKIQENQNIYFFISLTLKTGICLVLKLKTTVESFEEPHD